MIEAHPYIIAELASAHDGLFARAQAMALSSARAGVQSVKLQFWSDPDRLANRRHVGEDCRSLYRQYQIGADWLPKMAGICTRAVVDFGCTVYLPDDIETVEPHVDWLKVASFEAADLALVDACLETGRPVIVSTGMLACGDEAIAALWDRRDKTNGQLKLLHCVSAYPAPLTDARLRVCGLPWCDGFSDHTRHVGTGAVAVACGADILEVHVRSWLTSPKNPDAACALMADQLSQYVTLANQAADMVSGGPQKCPRPSEAAMMAYRVRGGV